MRPAALLGLIALLASGCAKVATTPTRPDTGEAWARHRAAVSGLSNWTLTGRIAIQDGEQAWNATLHWRQTDDRYRIRIIAPLAQGTVELAGSPGAVTLRTPKQEPRRASSPERLMEDALGWQVPVSGLRYWITGLDAPPGDAADLVVNASGQLERLHQDGWAVDFLRYTDTDVAPLPGKLYLESGRLQVRIVVTRWQIDSA